LKLQEGRFGLDTSEKFFVTRVLKPWPRLLREVGDAPSLGTFEVRMDGALSNLTQLKMSLPMAVGWTGWPSEVLSHPKPFRDSKWHVPMQNSGW